MVTILIPVGLTSERVYRANSQQADKSMAHIARPAIGPKRTFHYVAFDVAFGGKADMTVCENPLSRSLLGIKQTWRIAVRMSAYGVRSRSHFFCFQFF